MALTIKNLAIGTISNADPAAVILAGSTTKSTLVRNIMLTNTHTSVVTLNGIWLKQANPVGGNPVSRLVSPRDVQIAPNSQLVLDDEITLFAVTGGTPSTLTADKLTAKADVAGKLDYVINGMERDV